MNRIILLASLLSVLSFSRKKDNEELYSKIPEFLKPRIEELAESDYCLTCVLTRYTYKNKFYYHIYCGLWSCMYCELYDSTGNIADWGNEEFENFLENKEQATEIWSCKDND